MTVPGRVEAARLLLCLDPPAWFVRHARGVSEVAAWLGSRAASRGAAVSRPLVESAALLHDVDKVLPEDDPARALEHGRGSAAWLTRAGHPELGHAVAGHPVTRLAAPDASRWLAAATAEELIVAYADKRVGQRLESLDARFASWRRRYPDSDLDLARMRDLAGELERRVCRLADTPPDAVRRLRWTGNALRQARTGPAS
jgi:hypothetical protein